MTAQLDLEFQRPPSKRALIVITPDEINWLAGKLRGKGWQTSTQLGAQTEHQKRKLRAIVEHSKGAILGYPGSPGYKLFAEATITEIHRCVALKAQARLMLSRYRWYMRGLHHRTEPAARELFPTTNHNHRKAS